MNEATEEIMFSSEHPPDLLKRIIEDGATRARFDQVYRISDSGQCDKDAFICTALENANRDVNNRDVYLARMQNADDVGEWSTSCWDNLQKALKILACKERHADSPAILIGNILPESGYSILSTERHSIKALPSKKRKKKKSHIDWWITNDQDVSAHFSKLPPEMPLLGSVQEQSDDEITPEISESKQEV